MNFKSKMTTMMILALVLALAVPAMAGNFQDVPANHWAYDALEEVTEAGLITGHGDGSFKGNEALTRYEVAVLTSRVLDKIETGDEEVDGQTAEAINQLAAEFNKELTAINERLDQDKAVTITGETGIEYKDVNVDGTGTVPGTNGTEIYENPFDADIDGDDSDDTIDVEEYLEQYANFDFNIEKEDFDAKLELDVVKDYMAANGEAELDSIAGMVSTDDFVANFGEGQDLGWKDYLYYQDDNIDGLILNSGNTTVALGNEDIDAANPVRNVAVKQNNLLDLPLNVYAGVEDSTDRNVVAGVDTAFNLAGLDFTGEVAANDTDLDGKLARVGVAKDLGLVRLEGNYQYADNFAGIQSDDDFAGTEETATLAAKVSKDNPYTVMGVDVFGNYQYEYDLDTETGEEERYVEANKELGDIELAAIYDYEEADNKSDKVVSFAYAPEFDMAGVELAPHAKVAAIYDIDNEQAVNKEVGVDASYEVNDKLALTGGYAWADKEDRVDDGMEGEMTTAKAGLDYQVTDSATATVDYEKVDYTNTADAAKDYDAQSVTGKINVKF